MQILDHSHRICAQLGNDREPHFVRLAQGCVGQAANADLVRLLGRLHLDESLDVPGAVALLLSVVMELSVRFAEY